MNRSYDKWKEVPMPERMKHLPVDHRGYPIPANILKDDAGVYHFIINDEAKRAQQIVLQNCAICDGPLNGEFWFVGGPVSAIHPNGAYIDTAQHYACVAYALQVFPYLATRPYKRPDPEKIVERVQLESHKIFVDPTMMPGQPEVFLLVKSDGFDVVNGGQYVKPHQALEIEAWVDGVKQPFVDKAIMEYCSQEVLDLIFRR